MAADSSRALTDDARSVVEILHDSTDEKDIVASFARWNTAIEWDDVRVPFLYTVCTRVERVGDRGILKWMHHLHSALTEVCYEFKLPLHTKNRFQAMFFLREHGVRSPAGLLRPYTADDRHSPGIVVSTIDPDDNIVHFVVYWDGTAWVGNISDVRERFKTFLDFLQRTTIASLVDESGVVSACETFRVDDDDTAEPFAYSEIPYT